MRGPSARFANLEMTALGAPRSLGRNFRGHDGFVDLLQDFAQSVAKSPTRIVLLKLSHVADPPDVIANSVTFFVAPGELPAADLLAQLNRFAHRTIAVSAAAEVVDLAASRRVDEGRKCFHQIEAVDVIAHLLAAITEDAIWPSRDRALH